MQGRKLVLAAAVLATAWSGAATAKADPPAIVVADGETQEAFDYTAAIRERVWVDADYDSDAQRGQGQDRRGHHAAAGHRDRPQGAR